MTNPEMSPQEPEGVRWLQDIDMGHLIGANLPERYNIDGQPVKVEDFMKLYPPKDPANPKRNARDFFELYESMSPNDPDRAQLKEMLRTRLLSFLEDTPQPPKKDA